LTNEEQLGNKIPEHTVPVEPQKSGDRHGPAVAIDITRQTRSDDISVLWHELLSPLTLIKGYTSTLLQLSNDITEEQQQQYIRGIDSASNRLVLLLQNLRDIARLEETDMIIDQPVSLLDLLRKVVSEMQCQTNKHVIRLQPHAPLPRIKVDPEKIEQVVNNLVANAIKYSPQDSDIEVEVRAVRSEMELDKLPDGAPELKLPSLVVSVSDSGIGLPEGELDRIFDKFYRVNSKPVRTTPGAGLGLYICKIIVEAHGGRIWASNRPGGGSVFSFSLPLGLGH
jgi:signal transduction histidine kinase